MVVRTLLGKQWRALTCVEPIGKAQTAVAVSGQGANTYVVGMATLRVAEEAGGLSCMAGVCVIGTLHNGLELLPPQAVIPGDNGHVGAAVIRRVDHRRGTGRWVQRKFLVNFGHGLNS